MAVPTKILFRLIFCMSWPWVTAAMAESATCHRFGFEPSKNSSLPAGWRKVGFPKVPRPTHYSLQREGAKVVLKAQAVAAAAVLFKRVMIEPNQIPLLRWSWKTDHVIAGADQTSKSGDDYPARVYVLFKGKRSGSLGSWLRGQATGDEAGKALMESAALNYVWSNRAGGRDHFDNPYASQVKMILLRSGTTYTGRRLTEERNVANGYRRLFGAQAPTLHAIAIKTDTDNTGSQAVAYYADISLCPKP